MGVCRDRFWAGRLRTATADTRGLLLLRYRWWIGDCAGIVAATERMGAYYVGWHCCRRTVAAATVSRWYFGTRMLMVVVSATERAVSRPRGMALLPANGGGCDRITVVLWHEDADGSRTCHGMGRKRATWDGAAGGRWWKRPYHGDTLVRR